MYPLKTYEVVIYRDGTSATEEYNRDPETGELTYVGRHFRDEEQTALLVKVLRRPWMSEEPEQ